MISTNPTNADAILVTAATWYLGARTIAAIKNENLNATVVAGVYKKSKKIDKPELWKDADDTYEFDANQPETLDFKRFNAVCIIPSTNSSRVIQVSNMIEECKYCSPRPFIVLCTVADTRGYDGEIATSMRMMESMLRISGLQHVIINCGFLHQNFEWNASEMMNEEKIRLPVGNGRFSPVDARDVARFIAIVLKDPEQYEGQRFFMGGDMFIVGKDAADIASQSLGRRITFEDIPETSYFDNLTYQGCSRGMAKTLCELCAAIKKHDLERKMDDVICKKLNNRTVRLEDYLDEFSELYGAAEMSTNHVEANETKPVDFKLVPPQGRWGEAGGLDEGYAEAKEEETTYGVGEGWEPISEGWEPVKYGREEGDGWATEESGRDQKPIQYRREVGEGSEVKEADRNERPVQYVGENMEDWKATDTYRDQGPAQYGREEWEVKGIRRDQTPVHYGGEVVEERKATKADQKAAQYGREEREEWKANASYGGQRPVQYGREEQEVREAKQTDRERRLAKHGREEPEADRGRRPAVHGREERKAKGADRGEWKVKATKWGRQDEMENGRAPPAVEEENVNALERDLYYLKPNTGKRIDVLRKAQREYEELSRLLTATIDDLNAIARDRRVLLGVHEQLIKKLEGRKDEIDQLLHNLDRDIREQERVPAKERPSVVRSRSISPTTERMYRVFREDEKLDEGIRSIERYESPRRERYESPGREVEYASYRQVKKGRYPERERYRENRRARRSVSATHIGRELARGKISTKLGRELSNYKGDNFISRISHILYGWKDKGVREHRSAGGRGLEGSNRYRRGAEVYNYEEPRREPILYEHDFTGRDREYQERRRRDHQREYERGMREYTMERPSEYEDARPRWRGNAKASFAGDNGEEGRFESIPQWRKTETRARWRESGYGSGYVLVPKHVLQEAIRSC